VKSSVDTATKDYPSGNKPELEQHTFTERVMEAATQAKESIFGQK
jgi:hypothetical protein